MTVLCFGSAFMFIFYLTFQDRLRRKLRKKAKKERGFCLKHNKVCFIGTMANFIFIFLIA